MYLQLVSKSSGLQKANSIVALTVFTVGNQLSWEGRGKVDVLPVRTVETRNKILGVCQERGDEWANDVQARILHVHDLHAADAVYHKACSVNFRTMKQIPANPKCGISRMSRSN